VTNSSDYLQKKCLKGKDWATKMRIRQRNGSENTRLKFTSNVSGVIEEIVEHENVGPIPKF
jgi:hypothetical protein